MKAKKPLKEAVRGLVGGYTLVLNGATPSHILSGVYAQDFNPRKYPNEHPIVPIRDAHDMTTGQPIAEGVYPFTTGPEYRRRFPQLEGVIMVPKDPGVGKMVILRVAHSMA